MKDYNPNLLADQKGQEPKLIKDQSTYSFQFCEHSPPTRTPILSIKEKANENQK